MRKAAYILSTALLLTACARDNYTVLPDGPGSQTRMSFDLRECKRRAINEYYANNPQGGVIIGGAIGGVIGGLIAGAATNDPPSNMNRLTEACMKQRGYSGTSEG